MAGLLLERSALISALRASKRSNSSNVVIAAAPSHELPLLLVSRRSGSAFAALSNCRIWSKLFSNAPSSRPFARLVSGPVVWKTTGGGLMQNCSSSSARPSRLLPCSSFSARHVCAAFGRVSGVSGRVAFGLTILMLVQPSLASAPDCVIPTKSLYNFAQSLCELLDQYSAAAAVEYLNLSRSFWVKFSNVPSSPP